MRNAIFCAVLALLVAACGESPPALSAAALQGTVYELDGQVLDRSGVDVTLMETGASAVTDVNGEFRFEGLAPGRYTLDFDSAASVAALMAGEGEPAAEDEEGRPVVDVPEEGGEVEIRVKLDGDKVTEISYGSDEERHASARLFCPEECNHEVEGMIKLSSTIDGQRFAVCVWHLEPGTVIEVHVGDWGALAEANAEGEACVVREEELPLGVECLEELAGLLVKVELADSGDPLLIGEVPDLPAEKDEPIDEGESEQPVDEEPVKDGPIVEDPVKEEPIEEQPVDQPDEPIHDGDI